ncbi:CbrC family protein [Selenomonas caprae]|uniref:CbrC family protein n=1 Tax=Selenomonas caprae TaxID=2606905 RepID=A0A5D6WGZ9_9FIRM|nr:CbrC family protein [Selenomonas caprae]
MDDINELDELGCKEELFQEYVQCKNSHPLDFVRKYLHRDWDVRGYLFQCIYCGKYHLWVDVDWQQISIRQRRQAGRRRLRRAAMRARRIATPDKLLAQK